MLLCVAMSMGVFDGIPFVKDNLSSVEKVEAASGYDAKVNAFIKNPNWRNGARWGTSVRKPIISPHGSQQCTAYVADFAKYVFGLNSPWTGLSKFTEAGNIASGDTLHCYGYGPHDLVVLYRDGNNLYTAEGNYGNKGENSYVRVKKYGYRISGNKLINTDAPQYQLTLSYGWHHNIGTVKTSVVSYKIVSGGASNVTNNNARISGSMSPAGNVSSWGFWLSTDNRNFCKYTVSGGTTYSGKMSCDINRFNKLNYGTTYYYYIWAKVNGQYKTGSVKSFRTTATKPNIPTLKISNANQDIGLSDSGTVFWSAVANATYYKLYLYDSDNNLVEKSGNITGTKYAFSAAKETGTYRACIEAYNQVGTKGKSNYVSFVVHPDVTVTFKDADNFADVGDDYEPEELGTQTVHYGKSATAPANPVHKGYTFKGWDKSLSKVTEDVTVKAKYDINKYTVKYVDSITNQELGTEKVTYYSSATPVDFELPTGYVKTGYDGWDKEYKCITEDVTLRTSVGWYNEDFPIYAELLSAVREYDAEESDNEGYTIQAKVTNWDKSSTKGRVVVALKTQEGKLLTSTESSAFSVKKNANKTIEVFVPYNKAASIAEIYVVGQYKDAVPITTTASNNATLEIDQTNVLSNWSTEEPPENATKTEEREEYRYQDKETKVSTATSMAGYTLEKSSWVKASSGSLDYVSSFPAGYCTSHWTYTNYHKTPVTASETATKKTTVSTSTVGYLYYHWCRGATLSAPTNRLVDGCKTSTRGTFHAFSCGGLSWDSRGAFYGYMPNHCMDTYWWIGYGEGKNANIPIKRCSYTKYNKQFTYYRWKDFTDWSTTKPTESATRKVQSRKVYRYLSEDLMQEDTSGKERTIKGNVGEKFAGKEATLFIYKVDEASDYTNEYVAQTKLDDEGNYEFNFKLREEPSEKTGDLTVVLGIEGNSTAIYLDTIVAPKKEHTVRFFDYTGNVISTQKVEEGKAAELPDNEKMERTGYTFSKWSDTNINITEDKDIYPEYTLNKYNVVFVDWKANTVKVEEFEYGSKLVTPIAEEPDESEIVEWDLVAQGVDTVTTDLVVCTQYKKKTFDVKILGFDGEVLDEQNIEYGKSVILPEINAEENNCIFFGWKNIAGGENEKFTNPIIKSDTTLAPDFTYKETVANPVASVDSGEYKEEKLVELTTETKGASIYYTLDGSDPTGANGMLYKEAIKIEDATILKFYAKAAKKNDSDIVTNYYVVNYEGARSAWMPYAELPQEIKDNQNEYDIYSDTGYSYKILKEVEKSKDIKELEKTGWTKDSEKMSDYSEWQNEPIADDGSYLGLEVETQPVYTSTNKYQYTRFKYSKEGEILYAPSELEGIDGEMEEIELDNSMAIAGFLENGTTYFVRDGETWFNQKKVVGKTKTGEKYRSRHKIFTYAKWTDYTNEVPSENETREYKSSEVFSYVRHNKYLVSICIPLGIAETQIVEEGKKVDITSLEKVEGYEYTSLYKDSEFAKEWNSETDKVTSNISLYVKINAKKYEVVFKDSDNKVIDTQDVEYLDEAVPPVAPTIENQKFVGWSSNEYLCVAQNMEVKAKYLPEEEYATVSLSDSNITVSVDKNYSLKAEILPLSEAEELLIWESSDDSVAIVSDTGEVTGLQEGTATITATVEKTGEIAKCLVTVKKDDSNIENPAKEDEPNINNPTKEEANKGNQTQQGGSNAQGENNEPSKKNTIVKRVSSLALKAKGKSIHAKWKKIKGIKGYQIQYATNSKFKKKKALTTNKTTITIKKLSKKKTYYVRVRAYVLNGKKKVYGKWSKVKKVKFKK